MKDQKSKSKLWIAATMATLGSSDSVAQSSLFTPYQIQRARVVFEGLNNPATSDKVVRILQTRGFTAAQIKKLKAEGRYLNCEILLDSGASAKAQAAVKAQEAIVNLLIAGQPNRLDVIYKEVAAIPGVTTIYSSPVSSGVASGATQPSAKLEIAEDGVFFAAVKGVDRSTIYEAFRLALKHDAQLTHPAVQSGTQLYLDSAKVVTPVFGSGQRIKLSIRVQYPMTSAIESVSLDIPLAQSTATAEEMTVIALMKVAASRHLLTNDIRLRLELNAVGNVANRLLIARTLDRSNQHRSDASTLQYIMETLKPRAFSGGRNAVLSRLIISQKILSDYLAQTAKAAVEAKAGGVEQVARTNMFQPASRQNPATMTTIVPDRSKRVAGVPVGRRDSREDDYYDPLLGYYYPWAYFPNYGYHPFWSPYWHMQLIQSQDSSGRVPYNDYYERQVDAGANRNITDPAVYQRSDGQVVVVDPNPDSPMSPADLERGGWTQISSPDLGYSSGGWSTPLPAKGDDFGGVPYGQSSPETEAGRSTSTILVTGEAITTGESQASSSTGLFGGGWFTSSPAPTNEPSTTTTTTTGVDYTTTTTTTTTTGYDYTTTTTTTTTTGDYTTTTTTTTGDYTTTTTGDFTTTTTTGSDF